MALLSCLAVLLVLGGTGKASDDYVSRVSPTVPALLQVFTSHQLVPLAEVVFPDGCGPYPRPPNLTQYNGAVDYLAQALERMGAKSRCQLSAALAEMAGVSFRRGTPCDEGMDRSIVQDMTSELISEMVRPGANPIELCRIWTAAAKVNAALEPVVNDP